MSFSDHEIEEAHEHCFGNEAEIRASTFCVCYFCASNSLPSAYFSPSAIKEWLNPSGTGHQPGPLPLTDQATAFCPGCTFDMVIGDASGLPIQDPDFIAALNERF